MASESGRGGSGPAVSRVFLSGSQAPGAARRGQQQRREADHREGGDLEGDPERAGGRGSPKTRMPPRIWVALATIPIRPIVSIAPPLWRAATAVYWARPPQAMVRASREVMIEELKGQSTSQLAELGRKSDVINRLKIEREVQKVETIGLKSEVEALKGRLN